MTRAVQDIARSASEYSRVARKKPQKAQEAHKFLVPFVLFVVPVPLRCEFVHSFSAWVCVALKVSPARGYILPPLRGCIWTDPVCDRRRGRSGTLLLPHHGGDVALGVRPDWNTGNLRSRLNVDHHDFVSSGTGDVDVLPIRREREPVRVIGRLYTTDVFPI